jgi:hypothetical protein
MTNEHLGTDDPLESRDCNKLALLILAAFGGFEGHQPAAVANSPRPHSRQPTASNKHLHTFPSGV